MPDSMPFSFRVAVLDDDERLAKSTSRQMERAGIPTEPFTTPPPFIEAVEDRSQVFDLLITDYLLDVQNDDAPTGLDVIKQLREQKIPTEIILITGYEHKEIAENAVEEGIRGFLQKSFEPHRLLRAVVHALLAGSLAAGGERFEREYPGLRRAAREGGVPRSFAWQYGKHLLVPVLRTLTGCDAWWFQLEDRGRQTETIRSETPTDLGPCKARWRLPLGNDASATLRLGWRDAPDQPWWDENANRPKEEFYTLVRHVVSSGLLRCVLDHQLAEARHTEAELALYRALSSRFSDAVDVIESKILQSTQPGGRVQGEVLREVLRDLRAKYESCDALAGSGKMRPTQVEDAVQAVVDSDPVLRDRVVWHTKGDIPRIEADAAQLPEVISAFARFLLEQPSPRAGRQEKACIQVSLSPRSAQRRACVRIRFQRRAEPFPADIRRLMDPAETDDLTDSRQREDLFPTLPLLGIAVRQHRGQVEFPPLPGLAAVDLFLPIAREDQVSLDETLETLDTTDEED